MFLSIFFITISYLLLAAHALRGGDWGFAFALIALCLLTFTRELWLSYVAAVSLSFGAFIWVVNGADLISLRTNTGDDWIRLAAIMTLLFALTLFSAVSAYSKTGQEYFSRHAERGWFKASIFLLTALLLEIARSKVNFPILMVDRFLPGWGRAEIFLLALYAAWIGDKMYTPQGAKNIRPRIWAFFSLIFFGQLVLGLAGVERFLMTGVLHLPVPALIVGGPVFRGSGFFMPILFTVSVLLVGPAWCSHLCYIGAWDDQCSRLSMKPSSKVFMRKLIWLRFVLFLLVVGAAWGMKYIGISGYTAIWFAVCFGLVGILVMVHFSMKMGMMVHCTAFCPLGILSNLLGKLSPWRMRISSSCCKCMKCSKTCRYDALSKLDIEAGRPGLSCTMCGDCISSCSSSSINYKLPFTSASLSRSIFLVIIISLHALFLGVARI
ncbi:4Fe-4S binding protein [Maridesulfovibrio zosterae]|uniref:4Fe-4S binding protein n=1 Tax=Maridesulfovibrio zosterae TaxID=82171 RepID=UPI000403D55E